MTQAYNLSQFANKLNASGQTSNSGLQNSSVTINTGTGLSGGGTVALGASLTINNTGVTSLTAGSGISISGSTGAITITNTNVLTAGNGIGISGTVLSLNAPSSASIGSYAFCRTGILIGSGGNAGNFGGTFAGSNLRPLNIRFSYAAATGGLLSYATSGALTGTWQAMNYMYNDSAGSEYLVGLYVRVS